jgi:hypothetical protein
MIHNLQVGVHHRSEIQASNSVLICSNCGGSANHIPMELSSVSTHAFHGMCVMSHVKNYSFKIEYVCTVFIL